MTREEPTLPGFAADWADHDRYAGEREPRPHHDGERIRLHIPNGAPAAHWPSADSRREHRRVATRQA